MGAILLYGDKEKRINGFDPETTNNKMELKAVIEALKIIKKNIKIEIHTDSIYVKDGITKWIFAWKKMIGKILKSKRLKILNFGRN